MNAYLNGLLLGAGLIVAIGAQNAHVLRMGLMRQHVGVTVAICIAIDFVLIVLGVAGMGALIQASPLLLAAARWGGAAFLLWYGLRSWRAVLHAEALDAAGAHARITRAQAVARVVALSLLNPHLYLDTVVLLGSIGGAQAPAARPWFAAGAMSASALWFTGLGAGAARLAHVLARPAVWKGIDALTGLTMLVLAWKLASG